jgi:peptidoglycan hydrolase CwlO-like protein
MKNTKLEKSVERLQVDINDSANGIIYELTEEIETLENRIDELERKIEELTNDRI